MENEVEELKEAVKADYIERIGEEAYYKLISHKLKLLVPIKESIDLLFEDLSEEEKREEFKNAVISEMVFEVYDDEEEQIFQLGFWEIVLDVYKF